MENANHVDAGGNASSIKVTEVPFQPVPPLNILVIGAGIGGLTAAAALRKAGHHVEISDPKASISSGLIYLHQFTYLSNQSLLTKLALPFTLGLTHHVLSPT